MRTLMTRNAAHVAAHPTYGLKKLPLCECIIFRMAVASAAGSPGVLRIPCVLCPDGGWDDRE